MGENSMVWCVDYCTWMTTMIHSTLFLTEKEARSKAEQLDFCPYVSVYQTRDIWRFREKHSTRRV